MIRADDERAIRRVLLRWCRAIDRLDLPSIRTLFHADAIDDHVFYRGAVDGLVKSLALRHQRISFSCHQLGNILIEFASPTIALVETYVQVTQHATNDNCAVVVQSSWCRYIDRFEFRDAHWRIAHRLLVIDAAVETPLTSPKVFAVPAENQGRRDEFDPVFLARAELGFLGTS